VVRDYSCSLDIVEEHPEGLSRRQVGWLMGLSSDRILQIEHHALRQLYASDLGHGELRSYQDALRTLRDRSGSE
jgi:DNA-directed RNA polymerase sigma subunit (sigma70/sigma32)